MRREFGNALSLLPEVLSFSAGLIAALIRTLLVVMRVFFRALRGLKRIQNKVQSPKTKNKKPLHPDQKDGTVIG
jgi:hypothetical protein